MAPAMRLVAGAIASLAALAHAGTIAINGAGPADVQPRLEIRDLEKNADQWNLYMLAMADFKNGDQADPTSYYGVASVHGVPNEPYDGVNSAAGPNGYAVGWCPHDSNLFPGWHRAYVTLFEQSFMAHVKNIAGQFQGADHDRYSEAASTLRIPFWDWAMATANGAPVLPASVTAPNVNVNTPQGQQQIPNPLLQYNMHPLNSSGMIWSPWDNWNNTIRYPNTNDPDAVSNQQSAIDAINTDSSNLRNRLYNLYSSCTDYRGFGNSDQAAASICGDSLESIHNNIHNGVGGLGSKNVSSGHMTILPLAAFDPVFWLHHANVDRLFALWQGINPDSYSMDATNPQATYFYEANYHGDANTFLAPFHKDTMGGQHTTNTIRDWKQFGYTYPEFLGDKTSPADIRQKFNALYNPQNPSTSPTPVEKQDPPQQPMSSIASSAEPTTSAAASTPVSSAAAMPSPAQDGVKPFGGMMNGFGQEMNKDITDMLQGHGLSADDVKKALAAHGISQDDVNKAIQASKISPDDVKNALSAHGISLPHKRALMAGVQSAVSAAATPMSSVASAVETAPVVSDVAKPAASAMMKVPSMLNSTLTSTDSALNNMTSGLNSTLNNASTIEYTSNIACQPFALNGSYNIYVFMGKPTTENPSSWSTDKNLCGTYSSFSSPGMIHNTTATGQIPLTQNIAQKVASGLIPSLGKEHVLPYIQSQINWRVQNLNGLDIPAAKVPGLQIGVGSAHVQPATSPDQFPKLLGSWTEHPAVTHGKPGGLQQGQTSPFGFKQSSNSTSPSSTSGSAPYSFGNGTAPASPSGSGVAAPSGTGIPKPMGTAAPAPAPAAPAPVSPAQTVAPAYNTPSSPSSAPSTPSYSSAAPATGLPTAIVATVAGLVAFLLL